MEGRRARFETEMDVKRVHRAPGVDPFDPWVRTREVTGPMESNTVWHPMGA